MTLDMSPSARRGFVRGDARTPMNDKKMMRTIIWFNNPRDSFLISMKVAYVLPQCLNDDSALGGCQKFAQCAPLQKQQRSVAFNYLCRCPEE